MKYALGLVFVILLFFCFILFWPTNEIDTDRLEKQNTSSENTQDEILDSSSIEVNDEDRYESMKSEYNLLDKERRMLKQRLARLKHNMWGLKFEKNTAKEMSEILLNAHKLIKNPDMLGAFSDVESIKDEIMKIKFADKSLDQVSKIIDQEKNSN